MVSEITGGKFANPISQIITGYDVIKKFRHLNIVQVKIK